MKVIKKISYLFLFLVLGMFSALGAFYVYNLITGSNLPQFQASLGITNPYYNEKQTTKLSVSQGSSAEMDFVRGDNIFSFSGAIKKVAPSIVNVYTQTTKNNATINTYGSGIIMSADGYVVTNYHVIAKTEKIAIGVGNQVFSAKMVGFDRLTDLAVVRIITNDYSSLQPVSIPTKPPIVNIGDVVFAIGNPLNMGQSATLGIVSALGRSVNSEVNFEELIQTDVALNTGNSGGALINTNGDIIGINSLVVREAYGTQVSGLGFAVPIVAATRIMNQIIERGYADHVYLGVETNVAIDSENHRQAVVTLVTPNSPAFKSGIRVGDLIHTVNGVVPADPTHVFSSLSELSPGVTVMIELTRNGEHLKVPLVLGSYNEFNQQKFKQQRKTANDSKSPNPRIANKS